MGSFPSDRQVAFEKVVLVGLTLTGHLQFTNFRKVFNDTIQIKIHMRKRLTTILCILATSVGLADDAQDEAIKKAIAALKEGIELLEDNQIDDGAEEIRWGLELIDKAKQSGIDKYLIEKVGAFTGGEIVNNKAMGMSVTERIYKNADGDTVKVTFTRKSADGGGGFMAGLGGLAKLGLMQGERVRYGGVIGSAMAQGREFTIMLNLDDDSLLNISSSDVGKDGVDAFAREYPIRELNDAVSAK